jgi:hypothetical protein
VFTAGGSDPLLGIGVERVVGEVEVEHDALAQEKGDFARGGIEAQLTNTPSSVFQLSGLIKGRFDMAAIDNVIAYQEGQREAPVAAPPDLLDEFEQR